MASNSVTIFEVGPRDGLQNEKLDVPLGLKLKLIRGLLDSGIRELEIGAFVRPDKVPQMADTDQIFKALRSGSLDLGKARGWSLVPNRKGLERAIASGAKQIAVFTAATESFVQRNIGMSVKDSLTEFRAVIAEAKRHGIATRGYVSTAFYCPFEGKTPPRQAMKVIDALGDAGAFQISIGDTIGAATPKDVIALLKPAIKSLGAKRVAGHFHDTRGTALANALQALELGVRDFDSSAGGLGGCPFAPGATGNLATEDLVYMLNGMGLRTGIDLDKLCATMLAFSKAIDRPITSRYLMAYAAGKTRST